MKLRHRVLPNGGGQYGHYGEGGQRVEWTLIGLAEVFERSYLTAMPDFDLGPNDYRKQHPKTGRWHLPDDPKAARNMFFVAVVALACIYYWRLAVTPDHLFFAAAGSAFAGGILFATWLKDVY